MSLESAKPTIIFVAHSASCGLRCALWIGSRRRRRHNHLSTGRTVCRPLRGLIVFLETLYPQLALGATVIALASPTPKPRSHAADCGLRYFMVNYVIWLAVSLLLVFSPSCAPQVVTEQSRAQQVAEYAKQRRKLVDELRSDGISSQSVLDAMLKVPRHEFVPASYRHQAYQNRPLPIGHDQTISQPYIVAYMTEAAEVASGEKVLEIGTGSGYQAAVLAELAKQVYTIEIIPELADGARTLLHTLGYKNVQVKAGNGYLGWPEHAPSMQSSSQLR